MSMYFIKPKKIYFLFIKNLTRPNLPRITTVRGAEECVPEEPGAERWIPAQELSVVLRHGSHNFFKWIFHQSLTLSTKSNLP